MTSLDDAAARCAERDRLVRRRADLEAAIERATAGCTALRERLTAEARDVAALERLTLTNVLALVRGSRDDDLERERAEHRAAAYAVQQADETLAALRHDLDDVTRRLRRLARVDAELERARWVHGHALVAAGGPVAEQLLAVAEASSGLALRRRELDEAMAAGRSAHSHLEAAATSLSSADNWSGYDIWLGGGAISSAVKHGHLDDAAAHVRRAQQALDRFGRELADVSVPLQVDLMVSPTTTALDILFDNLFTDLSVGRKIARAEAVVWRNLRAVRVAWQRLVQLDAALRAEEADLARRRDVLLGLRP